MTSTYTTPSASITTTPPATHALPADCLFSPYVATTINAPASTVARCILDSAQWSDWNSFVPAVTITHDPRNTTSQNGAAAAAAEEEEEAEASKKGWLKVGTKMTFKCEMKGKGGGSSFNSKEEVTAVEMPPSSPTSGATSSAPEDKAYAIKWASRAFPSFMLRGERTNELKPSPPADNNNNNSEGEAGGTERCEYRTWQTFAGPLARIVRMQYERDLAARFVDWTRELKAFAEKTWAEREQ